MQIETLRFGTVEIDEHKIINFTAGLPGLEQYHKFALLQFEDGNPIHWLQCVDEPGVCLPVINTFMVKEDYAFDISDEVVQELDIKDPEDIYILSVVVVPKELDQMTVNLVAPIIINSKNSRAKQIIITNGEYNVRYPIFAALCKLIKEGDADAGAVAENK